MTRCVYSPLFSTSLVEAGLTFGQWAYRIPYALQWMWPPFLIVGIYFAPESPWWLVRKGKLEAAKKSLLRLTSLNRETDFDADETIAMMAHTAALEEKVRALLITSSPRHQTDVCMIQTDDSWRFVLGLLQGS